MKLLKQIQNVILLNVYIKCINHSLYAQVLQIIVGLNLLIIDGLGQIKSLSPRKDADKSERDEFWATIGGMGLTGVIVEATFSHIPIKTSKICVDTTRHWDIDTLMEEMIVCDKKFQYSVAWLDTLNKNGRGILTCGNHASPDQFKKIVEIDNLVKDQDIIQIY